MYLSRYVPYLRCSEQKLTIFLMLLSSFMMIFSMILLSSCSGAGNEVINQGEIISLDKLEQDYHDIPTGIVLRVPIDVCTTSTSALSTDNGLDQIIEIKSTHLSIDEYNYDNVASFFESQTQSIDLSLLAVETEIDGEQSSIKMLNLPGNKFVSIENSTSSFPVLMSYRLFVDSPLMLLSGSDLTGDNSQSVFQSPSQGKGGKGTVSQGKSTPAQGKSTPSQGKSTVAQTSTPSQGKVQQNSVAQTSVSQGKDTVAQSVSQQRVYLGKQGAITSSKNTVVQSEDTGKGDVTQGLVSQNSQVSQGKGVKGGGSGISSPSQIVMTSRQDHQLSDERFLAPETLEVAQSCSNEQVHNHLISTYRPVHGSSLSSDMYWGYYARPVVFSTGEHFYYYYSKPRCLNRGWCL